MINKLRNRRKERLQSDVMRRVRARYTMIDVKPAQGMFNRMCHENSVQWAKSRPEYGVAEVICIDRQQPYLHYLNTKNQEFFETTLGWRAKELEYYKIRDIHPSDWNSIHSEFDRSLKDWLYEFTNAFDRKILKLNRIL